jgi:hypothetical protein
MTRLIKCSFDNCNKIAVISSGNHINGGSIPFCKSCYNKLDEHYKAREEYFRTQAISEFKEKLKFILWDCVGKRATGEYISRHYMEKQINKTAQEMK